MAVNKRTRFEVLRRDNYTCRYCGGRAPNVALTVDHVVPTALGGSDDPSNLVTACAECNSGKSSTGPDERTVADVSGDAVRWAKAMMQAEEVVRAQYAADDKLCEHFVSYWETYTWQFQGKAQMVPLPADWRSRLLELLRAPGLTERDVKEAIDACMSSQYVKNEFAYCLGVLKNRLQARQVIAQQLIRDGRV